MCAHTDFQTYYITPTKKMNRTSCPCHFIALKLSKICTAVAPPATAMRSDKYGNKIIMIRERAKKSISPKKNGKAKKQSTQEKLNRIQIKSAKKIHVVTFKYSFKFRDGFINRFIECV